MPQTTGAISWSDCKIQISNDIFVAHDVDVSGFSNSVKVSGGERATAEFFTVYGDTPIVTKGKRSALEITVQVVYTEGVAEAYEVVRALYESGGLLSIKWSPKGGSTGKFSYLTSPGYITKPPYPGGASDSADALSFEISLKATLITKSVVTP